MKHAAMAIMASASKAAVHARAARTTRKHRGQYGYKTDNEEVLPEIHDV